MHELDCRLPCMRSWLVRSMCQPASVVLAQSKGPFDGLGHLLKYINVTTRKLDYATVNEVPLEQVQPGECRLLLCQSFYFFLSSLLVFSCLLCLSHAQKAGGHPEMHVQVSAAWGAGVLWGARWLRAAAARFCSCTRRGEAMGWAPSASCKRPHFWLALTFASFCIAVLVC